MQSLKSYFLTYCLLFFCSIILAQENEDWTPADSIYQFGMEAHMNDDRDLADNCFLYLHDATDYFLNIKDYNSAIEYAVCNQKLSYINYGENSHEHTLTLIKCASIFDELEQYNEALQYNLQACEIELSLYDENDTTSQISSLLITSLHNTACDMSQLGLDHIAINYMKAAIGLKSRSNYSRESHASSLSALAVMYSHLGDYQTAFDIDLLVLRFRKSIPADEHLAISYSNLASDLNHLGLTKNAIDYVKKGINIQKKLLKKEKTCYNSHLSVMYSNLSGFYNDIRQYNNAIKAARKAIKFNKQINNSICSAFGFLSYAYEQKKDTSQALKYAKQVIDVYEKTIGKTNGNYIIAKNNYAMLLYRFGYIDEYIEEYEDYSAQIRFYVQHLLQMSSPFSSANTWTKYYEDLVCHQRNIDAIERDAVLRKIIYNNILFYKSILLNINRNVSNIFNENEMKDTYNSSKSNYQKATNIEKRVILKFEIEEVENQYVQSSFNFDVSIDSLRRIMELNDICIEIALGRFQEKDSYYALILRKDWNTPKCVVIGNEAELDSMPYPQLQEAVWQAIIDSAQIKEGENIYFSTDGIFYNMPIEYLPTADGRNMSDKYNMFRVSSTRELCYRDTANTYSTAVLYGGLKYDATPRNLIAQNSSTRGWEESIHESVLSQWRADDRAKYNYLPYTLMEVDSISQTIGNAIQVTTYTDKEGSEESFKSLSGNSPSILHIATHGYYITPTQAEIMSKENMSRYAISSMEDRQRSVIDYSMERTGLLMAGAQLKLRGDSVPQMAEDGILSAKEISHLDLSNTDLVVLSACQTALGDITNDGVAGLQRGFKIAGVKSVLMSLWKVDDAATYLLMKQFYKSLFAGKNKQQALRDAQNYLRSYMVGNERPYNDIHYWGAFILLDAIEN